MSAKAPVRRRKKAAVEVPRADIFKVVVVFASNTSKTSATSLCTLMRSQNGPRLQRIIENRGVYSARGSVQVHMRWNVWDLEVLDDVATLRKTVVECGHAFLILTDGVDTASQARGLRFEDEVLLQSRQVEVFVLVARLLENTEEGLGEALDKFCEYVHDTALLVNRVKDGVL